MCSVCNKAFKRKDHLTDHLRTHTDETPYGCHFCNKFFSTKSSASWHMRKVHSSVLSHMRAHSCVPSRKRKTSSEAPYECVICNRSFKRESFLTKHRKDIHNCCPICDNSFSSEFQLSFHMRIHSNEAQHKSTTFKQTDELKTHLGVHSDGDSFQPKYGHYDEECIIQDGNGPTQNTTSNVIVFTGDETSKSQFGNENLGKIVPSENCEDSSPSASNTMNNQDLSALTSNWNSGKTSELHFSETPFAINIKTEDDA